MLCQKPELACYISHNSTPPDGNCLIHGSFGITLFYGVKNYVSALLDGFCGLNQCQYRLSVYTSPAVYSGTPCSFVIFNKSILFHVWFSFPTPVKDNYDNDI